MENFTHSYLLQEGKSKISETSHRMGNKFPTDLWGQVLKTELLSQQTSPCEGFFPSTDGEKTLTSQLENGHGGYNENCCVDQAKWSTHSLIFNLASSSSSKLIWFFVHLLLRIKHETPVVVKEKGAVMLNNSNWPQTSSAFYAPVVPLDFSHCHWLWSFIHSILP